MGAVDQHTGNFNYYQWKKILSLKNITDQSKIYTSILVIFKCSCFIRTFHIVPYLLFIFKKKKKTTFYMDINSDNFVKRVWDIHDYFFQE